jgi:transposase-like protein
LNTRAVTNNYRLNKWIEIIRECRSSGQTVTAWCAEHDINPKSYYYWLRKVRSAACEALTPINSEKSLIVPVDISALTTPSNSEIKSMSSDIVIRIGSITLELSNNASATLIENTLRAIQNVR